MQIFIRPTSMQAISFDLDDTLYDNRPAIIKAEAELLAHMHQHHPETLPWQRQHWRELKQIVLQRLPVLAHDPSAARLHVLTQGLRQLGYSSSQAIEAAKVAFECFYFHRSDFTVDSAVMKLLAQLGAKYRLIGITNGNVDAQRIGLLPSLDFVLNAGNGLRMKPYSDMFHQASARLQLPTAKILHVGDSLKSDVVGARHAGYQAAWLSPSFDRDTAESLGGILPQIQIKHISELGQLI